MSSNKGAEVISIGKVRDIKVEQKRRQYERILFRNMVSVYCVGGPDVLKALELVDVSEEGLSFQLPASSKNLTSLVAGLSMEIRIFFSPETYLPLSVKIMHSRPCLEKGSQYIRFGCSIDKSLQSYETYRLYVAFLQGYAHSALQDTGSRKLVFF